MQKKGIILFSGGLDSMLAVKTLQKQDIELTGINFVLPYERIHSSESCNKIQQYADNLNLKLRFIECNDEYIQMLKKPNHGYGKNVNPCIDCKIYFQKKAFEIMKHENASFIATGEVSGQRPMSQRRDMIQHIEKESGAAGYILRPLSIRFFEPTFAEKEGIVDRSKLLSIHGRGRYMQMELARSYGITEYATPAGGCLFTEPNYARRLQYLMKFHPDFNQKDMQLLRTGRHFTFSENCRILVTRNEAEAETVKDYYEYADIVAEPSFKGPTVLGFGNFNQDFLQKTADIIGRYGKPSGQNNTVSFRYNNTQISLHPESFADEELEKLRM